MKVFLIILGIILCIVGTVVYFQKGFTKFLLGTILFVGGIVSIGNGVAGDSDEYIPSSYDAYDENSYENDYDYNHNGSNVDFRGSQTGYTGSCKKCDCEAYDRSPDGICKCGHYKTDHTWHN